MTISDALHRLLLDNLTTATILLNDQLRLEYMNPAAEMLLAISGQRSHGYIALKSEEEIKVRTFVHPLEYELYYSC